MECLRFEPGAAGWKAQTKPRSYGGHMTTILNAGVAFVIRYNGFVRRRPQRLIELFPLMLPEFDRWIRMNTHLKRK